MRRRDRRDEERDAAPRTTPPPPEHALLALQRSAGNRAVSQVLARDANPALERRPAVRPPKPKLRTGREVDAIFDASPYFKDLVGARMKKVSLAKAMKVDDEGPFETAWVEYAKRSFNPDTNANYTEDEAKRYLTTKGVRAFQDEDHGEVHIRKERADLGTQLHEGLHLFSDDGWKRHMGYSANEGVTEWFTRKLGPEVGVERDDSSFLREYTSVTHLREVVDESVLAAAYFEGDVAGLQAKVDERRGKGAWRRWLAFLDANDFKGANALMREPAPADSRP
jgi:hypothetical protein